MKQKLFEKNLISVNISCFVAFILTIIVKFMEYMVNIEKENYVVSDTGVTRYTIFMITYIIMMFLLRTNVLNSIFNVGIISLLIFGYRQLSSDYKYVEMFGYYIIYSYLISYIYIFLCSFGLFALLKRYKKYENMAYSFINFSCMMIIILMIDLALRWIFNGI